MQTINPEAAMANTRGLQFRKLDLHVHTPASRCYEFPDHTAEEIVQAALEQGLDGIAVTDHNTAAWIGDMQQAAASTPLTLFPGVEISTHEGYHVVALFDEDVQQADVESFLGGIGLKAQDHGRSDVLCHKSVYEVLDLIHEWDGLAVLAHIDAHKGAFYELTTRDPETGKVRVPAVCTQLFNDSRYDAVEIVSCGLPSGFDPQHNIHRRPPFYQSSDNPYPENPVHHSKEGLAHRYTWFNLDQVSLEGLRQCFADPEVRIRLMEGLEERTWPHILRMEVGDKGFLAYQRFHFHPGLNSIIGGKGVGKSLAVEFLRFGLDQSSQNEEIRRDHESKLVARLEPFNVVKIRFRLANGVTYELERTYRADGESTIVCTNQETGEAYTGSVSQLFPIMAYSQTEVIKIAESEGAQLRLLDALIDPRPYQKGIDDLQARLAENDRRVAEALEARAQAEECREEIATLEEEIANINRYLNSPLLAEMKRAEAQRDGFEDQIAYLDDLLELQARFVEEVEEREPPALADDIRDDSLLQVQRSQSRAVRERFLHALAGMASGAQTAREEILAAQQEWMVTFTAIRERYEEALRGSDQAQLETQRRQLDQQKNGLERELERFRKLADQDLPALLEERERLLDGLDEQHHAYYAARKEKFDYLTQASEGRLLLSLEHAANRERYTDALNELLRGSGTSTVSTTYRRRIACKVPPRRLGEILIARDAEQLAEASELTGTMAERAMGKLWAHDDFAQVLALQHACYPEDAPSIQYDKGDGNYAELRELSVGQKCTALLIVALCDGEMPVIIDQPEDALDIASVWEDIAKKLRRGKYGRQFILTTHNSSLAVGSDSDTFMILKPTSAERAKVYCRGAIDRPDVRREVIDHLEGGDEPYKLRQRKYNI
jgi:hypothetical protein